MGQFLEFMHKGGPFLWVLLVMSLVSVSLMLERAWFWLRTNAAQRLSRVARMEQALRTGDRQTAKVLADDDHSVYGLVVRALLAEQYSDALATSVVETHRATLDRFMGTLSTIITAAPLVGLLGTVSGLISSFRLLADQVGTTDPRSVGLGLSEALLNTAAGLAVTVVTLFPYNAYRAQIDRTLGRIESILAAVAHLHALNGAPKPTATPTPPVTPAAPEPARAASDLHR
ncbi:MAG: MotA/TolQ/ExbB proton channel family protein [Planctomycetota bacterium]|nr:MotA/TolQ/ExbB proton channel family protein [Planctomycetota bacterium]